MSRCSGVLRRWTFGNGFNCCAGHLNFGKGIPSQIINVRVLSWSECLGFHTGVKIAVQAVRRVSNSQKCFRRRRHVQRVERSITDRETGKKYAVFFSRRIRRSVLVDRIQRRFEVDELRKDGYGRSPRLQSCLGVLSCEQALRVCTAFIGSSNLFLHQGSVRLLFLLSRTAVGVVLLYECNGKRNARERGLRPCGPLTLSHAEPLGSSKAIDRRISHVSFPDIGRGIVVGGRA